MYQEIARQPTEQDKVSANRIAEKGLAYDISRAVTTQQQKELRG